MTDAPPTNKTVTWLNGFSSSAVAVSRNIAMLIGGMGAVLGLLGISQSTQDALKSAVESLGTGVSAVALALSAIAAIVIPLYTKWKASPAQQVKTVGLLPGVAVGVDAKVADPKIVALAADPKVEGVDLKPNTGKPIA